MKLFLVACLVATALAGPTTIKKRNILPGDSRYNEALHGAHGHHDHSDVEIKKALVSNLGFYSNNAYPSSVYGVPGLRAGTPIIGSQYANPFINNESNFGNYQEAAAQFLGNFQGVTPATPTIGSTGFPVTGSFFPTSTIQTPIQQEILIPGKFPTPQSFLGQNKPSKISESVKGATFSTTTIRPTKEEIDSATKTKTIVKDSSLSGQGHTSVSIEPSVSFETKGISYDSNAFGPSYDASYGSPFGSSFDASAFSVPSVNSGFASTGFGKYISPSFERYASDFGLRYGSGPSVFRSGYNGPSVINSAYKSPSFEGISNVGSYGSYGSYGNSYPGFSNLKSYSSNFDAPVRTVDHQVLVRVPQPFPVQYTKNVPYSVPVPTPVDVPRPYLVRVPQPVPVHVDRPVPVEIPRPVPYPVPQVHRVPTPVPYPQPIPVAQPYPVPQSVPVPHPYPVPQRVEVPQLVHIPQPTAFPHADAFVDQSSFVQSTPFPESNSFLDSSSFAHSTSFPTSFPTSTPFPVDFSSSDFSQSVVTQSPFDYGVNNVVVEANGDSSLLEGNDQQVVVQTTERPFTSTTPSIIENAYSTTTLRPIEVATGGYSVSGVNQKYGSNGGYVY